MFALRWASIQCSSFTVHRFNNREQGKPNKQQKVKDITVRPPKNDRSNERTLIVYDQSLISS